jgi:hypothetical protein
MIESTRGDSAFAKVFDRLRRILEPYGHRMHVVADSDDAYGVDMAAESERNPTTWFAGVRVGKAYVSYYLMPIYVEPALLEGVSPDLKQRMQGKSCFNFKSVDETLLAELEGLTRQSYEHTAGDPAWGVAKREEHGMAYRKAMSTRRRPGRGAAVGKRQEGRHGND